jgi:hypothetical protein
MRQRRIRDDARVPDTKSRRASTVRYAEPPPEVNQLERTGDRETALLK